MAVRDETLDSEEVRALKKKGDPNATPAEIAAAAEKRKEVGEKFHKEISAILTHDQKALIQTINDAYAKVVADVAEEYQPKIEAAKGNADDVTALRREQREAVVAAFGKKLDGVLSENQRTLVKKAAEEEAKRRCEQGEAEEVDRQAPHLPFSSHRSPRLPATRQADSLTGRFPFTGGLMLTPITIRHDFRPVRRSLATGELADLFGLAEREPPHTIAENLTLDVRPGDVVLFTGPSGSGKTSLLRAAASQLGAIDASRLRTARRAAHRCPHRPGGIAARSSYRLRPGRSPRLTARRAE